jgi:hypothetical protein
MVEIRRGDIGNGVALIISGVVDEDVNGTEGCEGLLDGGLERSNVGEIAVEIEGRGAAFGGQGVDELVGRIVLDIEESNAGALAGEVGDDGLAYAGGASGDENGAAAEAWVARKAAAAWFHFGLLRGCWCSKGKEISRSKYTTWSE